MKSLYVKSISNRGRFGEYPAMRNTVNGAVYVDVTLGLPRFLSFDTNGENIHGDFVGYNIPGHWHTFNGEEPDCPLKRELSFNLAKDERSQP